MKDNFATEFHKILKEAYNIETEVVGYANKIAKYTLSESKEKEIRQKFGELEVLRHKANIGKTAFWDDNKPGFFRNPNGQTNGFMVKWILRWKDGKQETDFE